MVRSWLVPAILLLVFAAACEDAGGKQTGDPCSSDEECASGVCRDEVCIEAEADDDGDGLFNRSEARLGLDPARADTDGDGVPDLVEVQDPGRPVDSDGDGRIDAIESRFADADGDCTPDQVDADDAAPTPEAATFLRDVCQRGVCGATGLAELVTVACDKRALVCRHGDLPAPWAEEEGLAADCDDGLDNDCDGVTDEGGEDSDDDGAADCVDDDDDDDGVPDDEDCRPLDARCGLDCADRDGDGEPDCRVLCVAPIAETCDDDVACTVDTCDEATGCVHTPDDAPCDDENPCTVDVCAAAGCTNTAAVADCDDGDPCTEGDMCASGTCRAGTDECECRVDTDCAGRQVDACTGEYRCDTEAAPYRCVLVPETVVTCDPAADTYCLAAVCDPETGTCALQPRNEGRACDDADPCTRDSVCTTGVCVGTADPELCPCTTTADCVAVDDGDVCNGVYYCATNDIPFRCVFDANSIVRCSSAEDTECMANQCAPQTGECRMAPTNEGEACDDGLACTGAGACTEGGCAAGTPLTCDDGNECTVDACTEGTGCTHVGDDALCDDENPCTDDRCGATGCENPPNSAGCDDGDPCTTGDVCSAGRCGGTDECQCHTSDLECVGYDDGDLCNGIYRCNTTELPYLCELDPTTARTCDSSGDTFCASNLCEPATGECRVVAQNEGEPCDDGDPCTAIDYCSGIECVPGQRRCACETDADCPDDGDLCNGVLFCDTATLPYACRTRPDSVRTCDTSDDTYCRATVCDPTSGECVATLPHDGGPCTDGDACTTGDTCTGGVCLATGSLVCDDDVTCTVDACDPATGCTNLPDDTLCDDAETCTVDSCDPVNDCQNGRLPDETECQDGDPCTAGDACANGTCVAGAPDSCDDGHSCTEDACAPGVGCGHTAVDAVCDDEVGCTVDRCDLATGCSSVPDDTLCPPSDDRCFESACDPLDGCGIGPSTCECLALRFASAGRVLALDSPGLSGGAHSLTIEAWVRVTGENTEEWGNQLVTKLSSGQAGDWSVLALGSVLVFRYYPAGGGPAANVFAPGVFLDTDWRHIAVVVDHAGATVRMYRDGLQVGETAPLVEAVADTDAPVFVGPSPRVPGPAFTGDIDEVRIWSVARSEADIGLDLGRSLLGTEAGLEAYWPFEDVSPTGTGSADLTPNHNDLIYVAGAPVPAPVASAPLVGCPPAAR